MQSLNIILDGEGAWPDLDKRRQDVVEIDTFAVAGLAHGMQSGAPSVAIRIDLPDDHRIVFAQTSLKLFLSAADALKAKYGDPRLDPQYES